MSIIGRLKEAMATRLTNDVFKEMRGELNYARNQSDFYQESLSRLQLDIENEGYFRLTQLTDTMFDRDRVHAITRLSINMALKNPITRRSINIEADYVFGLGIRFVAKHPDVQAVIDENLLYDMNRKVLTSHPAMLQRHKDLQVYGNLYIACFTNPRTGRVTYRSIDALEVSDIIRDPNDYQRELFIKRTFDNGAPNLTIVYHPCLGLTKDSWDGKAPWTIGRQPTEDVGEIQWNAPIYHVGPNKFGKEKFGIPHTYSQMDWSITYNRFLGDWTSIIRAYAKMALKITGLSGKKQAAAAKGTFNTSVSLSNPLEKNPSAVGGSIPLLGKGLDIEAVKTAGATTPASDGQPILNMAGCAVGLPGTFFGDVTKDGLDRSTELHMISVQRMWDEIWQDIMSYTVLQAAICPDGMLTGWTVDDSLEPFEDRQTKRIVATEEQDPTFELSWPEVLEHNVTDRVRALSNAITMFGKVPTDIIPDKTMVARMFLEALNVQNIEKVLPRFLEMWTKNMSSEEGKPVDPNIIPPPPPQVKAGGAEDAAQGGDVGANG